MRAHQEIRMTIPTAGSAPRGLSTIIRAPRAPSGPMRFSSLKDAMTYIKKKQIEEIQDEYEG